ncbi:MAG: OmpA family protein [Spirochaetales bacterium]|nr:OmpA family protein [Spirochaetales bacterium]
MPEDHDLISSQTHELNYLLKKWEKKQSRKNREILRDTLKDFRADKSCTPHTRELFYKYVEEHDILKLLEDSEQKKSAGRKNMIPDVETDDLTIDDPYIHKAEKKKTKIRKERKQKIQIQDLTTFKNQKSMAKLPGVKAYKRGGKAGGNRKSKKTFILILVIILVILLIIGIISVGTCLSQNARSEKTDTSFKEDSSEGIQENIQEGKENFTIDSLKNFLKNRTPVYFQSDLDVFIKGEERKIEELVLYLDNYTRVELSIEGHTANTGQPGNEMELSIRRAKNVERLLKSKTGKVHLIVETRGYGAIMEAIKNPSGEKMTLNRRVEITVKKAE